MENNNEEHKKISGMYIPPELYLNPKLTLTEMYLFPLIKDLCTNNRGCYASNHYLSTRFVFLFRTNYYQFINKFKKS